MILPSSHTDDRSLSGVCSGVFNSCRIVVFNYADQFYIIRLYELYLRTLNLLCTIAPLGTYPRKG